MPYGFTVEASVAADPLPLPSSLPASLRRLSSAGAFKQYFWQYSVVGSHSDVWERSAFVFSATPAASIRAAVGHSATQMIAAPRVFGSVLYWNGREVMSKPALVELRRSGIQAPSSFATDKALAERYLQPLVEMHASGLVNVEQSVPASKVRRRLSAPQMLSQLGETEGCVVGIHQRWINVQRTPCTRNPVANTPPPAANTNSNNETKKANSTTIVSQHQQEKG